MKVYLVFRVVRHEGWDFMGAFDSSKKAWEYKELPEHGNGPEDVSYVVQEEEVK